MHLLDQRMLGAAILILLGVLVGVKRAAAGSILDKPTGNFLVQLVADEELRRSYLERAYRLGKEYSC